MLLAVLAVAVVGGRAAVYVKVIRPKQQEAAGPEEDYGGEPEDYEDMEDDRPPWDEDDPDENSDMEIGIFFNASIAASVSTPTAL